MNTTIRLLLVEDVRLVREMLKSLINDQPDMHVAATIDDAKAAMVAARDLRPHVALIGSLRPDDGRLQLVRGLRATLPDTKVVVMDFWGSDDRVADFVQAGAHAFILKDTAAPNLLHAIRVAAGGGPVPALARPGVSGVPELSRHRTLDGNGLTENGFSQLTQREREISVMISQGRSNKEIARELKISLHTVKAHVRGIMGKLALRSRVEIAAYAFQGKGKSPFLAMGFAMAPGGAGLGELMTEAFLGVQAVLGSVGTLALV